MKDRTELWKFEFNCIQLEEKLRLNIIDRQEQEKFHYRHTGYSRILEIVARQASNVVRRRYFCDKGGAWPATKLPVYFCSFHNNWLVAALSYGNYRASKVTHF